MPGNATKHIDVCRNPDVTHTRALMAALKGATELYLGTNICYATFNLDGRSENKIRVAKEALGPLGLHVLWSPTETSRTIVSALSPEAFPADDKELRPVLAIDYSMHCFTIGLYSIEERFVDPVEGYVGAPRIDEDNQLDALRDTLSRLFANPLTPITFPGAFSNSKPTEAKLPEDLYQLIIYGDDAHNSSFRRVLAEALAVPSSTGHTHNLIRDAIVSKSVFDAPAHFSRGSQDRLNWIEPSAFGCKWRSKLYFT